jgi:hypothetical protein
MNYYKHLPGTGLHYIDKYGHTSVVCILHMLDVIALRNRLGNLATLWNTVYPEDTMSTSDWGNIIAASVHFLGKYFPESHDDSLDVIQDLRRIKCDALADYIETLLKKKGVIH